MDRIYNVILTGRLLSFCEFEHKRPNGLSIARYEKPSFIDTS